MPLFFLVPGLILSVQTSYAPRKFFSLRFLWAYIHMDVKPGISVKIKVIIHIGEAVSSVSKNPEQKSRSQICHLALPLICFENCKGHFSNLCNTEIGLERLLNFLSKIILCFYYNHCNYYVDLFKNYSVQNTIRTRDPWNHRWVKF